MEDTKPVPALIIIFSYRYQFCLQASLLTVHWLFTLSLIISVNNITLYFTFNKTKIVFIRHIYNITLYYIIISPRIFFLKNMYTYKSKNYVQIKIYIFSHAV